MSIGNGFKWDEFPLLALDTETTGINVYEDHIATAALVEVYPGLRPIARTLICDPGVEIPEEAAAVNGLSREYLQANATHTPADLVAEIALSLTDWMLRGRSVVVFNGAFDFTILEASLLRYGLVPISRRTTEFGPVLDVHVLDKYADPYRKGSRKLIDVCQHYGVVHTGAHDATADALATARLFPQLMRLHAGRFPAATLGSLQVTQQTARRNQMDSLRSYFDRQGITHDGCDGGWPLYDGLSTPRLDGVA